MSTITRRPPRKRGEALAQLLARQQSRLDRNREVAERRRLEEAQRHHEEVQKRLESERIEYEKKAKVVRRQKQARHLQNWNVHFGRAAIAYDDTHTKSFRPSSNALSPSSTMSTMLLLPPPAPETTSMKSISKVLVTRRKRSAGGNHHKAAQMPALPFSSAEVIREAHLEVVRHRQQQKELEDRQKYQLQGPAVGNTWMKSIALLQKGERGHGIFTSTALEQRTTGSCTLLIPPHHHPDSLSFQRPLRPGETTKEREHPALFEEEEEDDVEEEEEEDASPVWRTDLENTITTAPTTIHTITTTRHALLQRTTYVDATTKNMLYSREQCRSLVQQERIAMRLVFAPLRFVLRRKHRRALEQAWLRLWVNVEHERARMFRLGESRLNHRKARKHHWFVHVGTTFTRWKERTRLLQERRLRIGLLMLRKRIRLLHTALQIRWKTYMDVTKKEYADRVTKAYSYWLHAAEAKAFRGWKDAVARGISLRRVMHISKKWQLQYQRNKSFQQWKLVSFTLSCLKRRERRRKTQLLAAWLLFVTTMRDERRYLQRAGRRWRRSLKQSLFQRWQWKVRTHQQMRELMKQCMQRNKDGALQWGMDKWKSFWLQWKERDNKHQSNTHHVHNGLCDCLQRFHSRTSKSNNTTTKENTMQGRQGQHGQRRRKKRGRGRRRRRVLGEPLRPFRCTVESHLERRLMDAHAMVSKTMSLKKMTTLSEVMDRDDVKAKERRVQNRRESTVLRKSHWM